MFCILKQCSSLSLRSSLLIKTQTTTTKMMPRLDMCCRHAHSKTKFKQRKQRKQKQRQSNAYKFTNNPIRVKIPGTTSGPVTNGSVTDVPNKNGPVTNGSVTDVPGKNGPVTNGSVTDVPEKNGPVTNGSEPVMNGILGNKDISYVVPYTLMSGTVGLFISYATENPAFLITSIPIGVCAGMIKNNNMLTTVNTNTWASAGVKMVTIYVLGIPILCICCALGWWVCVGMPMPR